MKNNTNQYSSILWYRFNKMFTLFYTRKGSNTEKSMNGPVKRYFYKERIFTLLHGFIFFGSNRRYHLNTCNSFVSEMTCVVSQSVLTPHV